MRAGVFVHSCEFSLSFLSMVFVFKTLQNCEPLQFVYLSDMSLFQSGREFQLERILELCSPDSKFYLNIDFLFFQSFFFFFSSNVFLLPEACSTDPNGLKPKLFPKLRRSYSLPCFGPRRVYSLLDSPAEFPLASLDSFWLQWHV